MKGTISGTRTRVCRVRPRPPQEAQLQLKPIGRSRRADAKRQSDLGQILTLHLPESKGGTRNKTSQVLYGDNGTGQVQHGGFSTSSAVTQVAALLAIVFGAPVELDHEPLPGAKSLPT